MADAADFTLRLVDEASGPAKNIQSSLKNVNAALKNAGGGSGLMGAVGGGVALGLALEKVGEMALHAAAAVVKLGFDAAKAFAVGVVEAAAFVEKTTLALKMLSRGGGDATAQLKRVTALAVEFGLPVQDTIKAYQKLLAMQFKPEMAEQMIKMTADLQAIGAGAEETKRVLLALTQIKAKGRVQAEELLQLAEAGVSTELVMQSLSKALGKSTQDVRKLMEAGKITADQGLAAIAEAVKVKTGESALGEVGRKWAQSTLTGMWNVWKARGEALMGDIGSRVLKPLQEALAPIAKDLTAALDSPEFKAALDSVVGGFTWFFGAVKAGWPIVKEFLGGLVEGLKPLKDVGSGFMSAMGPILQVFGVEAKDAASGARLLGQALALVIGALAVVGGVIASVVAAFVAIPVGLFRIGAAIGEFAVEVVSRALELGTALIDGFVNGITAGAARVIAAVKGVATSAIGAAGAVLKIGSPSKVFEQIGVWSAEGFAGGMESGASDVRTASSQMTGAALSGVGGGGGGAPSFGNITVQVTVDGSKNVSPEEQGEQFGARLHRELVALFDGMEPAA